MGIYNCASTLPAAIDSILAQSFSDWELIMCDDGSSDDTYEIAQRYMQKHPDRIVVLKNEKNMGLNYTLNKCISVAKSPYIARMDGDDQSLPERFQEELRFLEENREIAIVGAAMDVFDEQGVWGKHVYKERPEKKDFLKGTPFGHPVSMVRAEAYRAVDGYTDHKRLQRVEDYHLWVKMYSKGYVGANLPQSLYLYRDDRNGYAKRKFRYRINEAYVKHLAIKMLHLPVYGYIHALRPILVGLLPYSLYNLLHKRKWRR